ncbi:hypothetical protein [Thermococcus barophilus]|uniref:Uncharacterized protein n=1 Tax=Thermococcus barophilus (strain DSM 11836 / MP) TaxID=391623 RepID=F0LMV4_THEBM|nr:hypothetical protein [Thermococcus barophilus]ADT84083.1 hypothetical protein TERMP_01107 [Thermococcus barophilus MP]
MKKAAGVIFVLLGAFMLYADHMYFRPPYRCVSAYVLPLPVLEVGVKNITNGEEVYTIILALGIDSNKSEIMVHDSEQNLSVPFIRKGELYYPPEPRYINKITINENASTITVYYLNYYNSSSTNVENISLKISPSAFTLNTTLRIKPTKDGFYLNITLPTGNISINGNPETFIFFGNNITEVPILNEIFIGKVLNATLAYDTHDPVVREKLWLLMDIKVYRGGFEFHTHGLNVQNIKRVELQKGFSFKNLILYDNYTAIERMYDVKSGRYQEECYEYFPGLLAYVGGLVTLLGITLFADAVKHGKVN